MVLYGVRISVIFSFFFIICWKWMVCCASLCFLMCFATVCLCVSRKCISVYKNDFVAVSARYICWALGLFLLLFPYLRSLQTKESNKHNNKAEIKIYRKCYFIYVINENIANAEKTYKTSENNGIEKMKWKHRQTWIIESMFDSRSTIVSINFIVLPFANRKENSFTFMLFAIDFAVDFSWILHII